MGFFFRGNSIICGLRNGTVEIWNIRTLKKEMELLEQHGSVQVNSYSQSKTRVRFHQPYGAKRKCASKYAFFGTIQIHAQLCQYTQLDLHSTFTLFALHCVSRLA